MPTRLPRLLIAIALASSIGLHWVFLQSVAWVGMVVNYSQTATLTEALGKTFDGKHPCSLCEKIAKEKRSEKKKDIQIEGKKITLHNPAQIRDIFPPTRFQLLHPGDDLAVGVSEPPLLTPPRVA